MHLPVGHHPSPQSTATACQNTFTRKVAMYGEYIVASAYVSMIAGRLIFCDISHWIKVGETGSALR
jgi:hypothetical protein